MNRKGLVAIVVVVALYIIVGTVHHLILGNAQAVTLNPAPQFAGIISQALGETGPNNTLPADNVDYHLTPHGFNNNTWYVVNIQPIHQNFEPSVAVLKKTGGIFTVVISPTNALPAGELTGLPSNVSAFLHTQVAVYQQIPGQ